MRLSVILGLLLFTIIGFMFCQCTMDQNKPLDFVFPSAIINSSPADSTISFIAEEGLNAQLNSGTHINIPKGALTTFEGQLVNGKVSLNIREYKDAIDLMADGISMEHENGETRTAGGIKLEVYKNEQKLFLDPTKSVEINLACFEKDEDYNLYLVDKKNNAFENLGTVSPQINEAHVQFERSTRKLSPQIKFPLDEEHLTFSYKGILDVIYNNDLTNVSHPTTQKKMKEYGLRWSSVNVEAFIDFQGKQEFAALMVWKNISKKPFPDWIKNASGELKKINKKRYRLLVEEENTGEKFSTQLEAVIPLRELFALGPAYWNKDYKLKIKNFEKANSRLSEIPSAFRHFKTNRFGVFNWQKSFDETESETIIAQLKFPDLDQSNRNDLGFYYVSSDRKCVNYYPKKHWNRFSLFDDPGASIISILPNHDFYYFHLENSKKIDFVQLQKMNNPSFLFKMKKATRPVKNREDLRMLINTISAP